MMSRYENRPGHCSIIIPFQVRSGQVRSDQVRSGHVRSDQVRSGQVGSGRVGSSGQVTPMTSQPLITSSRSLFVFNGLWPVSYASPRFFWSTPLRHATMCFSAILCLCFLLLFYAFCHTKTIPSVCNPVSWCGRTTVAISSPCPEIYFMIHESNESLHDVIL